MVTPVGRAVGVSAQSAGTRGLPCRDDRVIFPKPQSGKPLGSRPQDVVHVLGRSWRTAA